MKTKSLAFLLSLLPLALSAQAPRPGSEFQLRKISKNLITAPQFTYTGAQQYQANQRDRWLEVEVEFTATPEFTDELTFKYYILFNGKLLTGEVTHTNIPAGRDNRSVMYVAPRTLARLMDNRPMTPNAIQNIAVQLVQQGAVKSELSMDRAQPQWFASMPQVAGFVLNKNETPFAPLYWDRYEQIKAPLR
ncbi:MAG: Amuc_1102 family pilus-like protein [Chthoniobacterales bacterium]